MENKEVSRSHEFPDDYDPIPPWEKSMSGTSNCYLDAKRYAGKLDQSSGYVYFSRLKPFSWSIELDDPSKVVPGVLAVRLDNGCELVSHGGNDEDGAERWSENVSSTQPR